MEQIEKGKEEEIQEDVQRDSKVVKDSNNCYE